MRSVAVALALAVAACVPTSGTDDAPSAVATAYPLTWLVETIAPRFEVVSLAARGQDPHDLELTPQQRAAVEQSDLVVYLGDIDFQPQVETAMSGAEGVVVSAADVLGDERLRTVASDHDDEHDAAASEHADEGDAIDPHIWFDASLMARLAISVGDAAAEADPAHAVEYRNNAERVEQDLFELATHVAERLADCRHNEVVVSHEAYEYLLAPHDLTQHGISGAAGHSEASPQDIARLALQIRDLGLPAVLSEPVEGRTDAEAVAAEAGVEVIDIYSLDIVDDEQAERGYPALLLEQAEAVAAAAECGP